MPHEEMNEQQVAAYLKMDAREVAKLASRGRLPGRKVEGAFRFYKGQIDHWVEVQMHTLGPARLADIEKGVSEHHGFDQEAELVWPLIDLGGVTPRIAVPLASRTRDAAIRDLVGMADAAGMVCDKANLVQEVRKREELCSTAMSPHVAIPHPRHPVPYDISASFICVGLSQNGIVFGNPDGSPTRLFFLICCKDDRTHLHVLARLAAMLHDEAAVDELLNAPDADEMAVLIQTRERQVMAER
jgi:PTS system nitrogen regulatory IIA component